ncbi:MAG: hypothetical protein L3J67_13070 [Hyphomicrobiaceae bacterium]|nr:hypothetical protein [Hyphomicrobiaceae bacterium]
MLSHIKGPVFASFIAFSLLSASAFSNIANAAKADATDTAKAKQDPRAGEAEYERSKRLLSAIDEILKDTAKIRHDARKLPSKHEYSIIAPPWVETREDRQQKVNRLLDAALEIVTEVPIVALQKKLRQRRDTIKRLENQIATLREKQLDAPDDAFLPGYITDTVASIDEKISDLTARIKGNKKNIKTTKEEIAAGLRKSGIEIKDAQLDVLLGSVIGSDVVKLVAAFEAARAIDQRLAFLMDKNGENVTAARRYFAMHASLFALLVHAQELVIDKIDTLYLPRLRAIIKDIRAARRETYQLLRKRNRIDQRNTLLANLKSQTFSEKVAKTYRSYLLTQRDKMSRARQRTLRDLRIADNTYLTVEASFQLRSLIKDASTSFEAIRRLEAPGFDNVFRNKDLRREFENLTSKLAPTS